MGMTPYGYDYGYDYGYGYGADSLAPIMEGIAGIVGVLVVFLGLLYLLMLAISVTSYVLQSLGLYTVAKRRGIRNPWLSWVPIGCLWIMGSLSDQYCYVSKGKVRNRRKVLLGLSLGLIGAEIVLMVIAFGILLSGVAGEAAGVTVGALLGLMLLLYCAILVTCIVMVVFTYIALYDVFRSCDPDSAVLFLVLSIVFGVLMPLFLFVCRKKDLGMPPRKPEQKTPEVAMQPELIAQQTVAEESLVEDTLEEDTPIEEAPVAEVDEE